ncbi:MAG: SpoIIIAH-like family protein [Clostridiales bacterium]|nr:SpoIIIAH-like family protein [Clostridiales bacterium]
MATNKKKIIILCAMVVLLVASGYLNYYLTQKQPPDDAVSDNAVATFFAAAKAERTTNRNGAIDYYNAVINSASSKPEEIETAKAARDKLAAYMEYESNVETFLFGKGYAASLAACAEGGISVTVADNDLTAVKVAEIKNFIIENTEFTLGQISIRSYPV